MTSESQPFQGLQLGIKFLFDLLRSANVLTSSDDYRILCVQDVTVNVPIQSQTTNTIVLKSHLCEQHCDDLINLIALTCDTRSLLTKSILLKAEPVLDDSTTQETDDVNDNINLADENEAPLPTAQSTSLVTAHRYACYFVFNKTQITESQTAQNCQYVLLHHDAPHKGTFSSLKVTLTRDTEKGDNTIGNTTRPFMIVENVPNPSHPRLSTEVHLHPSPHNSVILLKAE